MVSRRRPSLSCVLAVCTVLAAAPPATPAIVPKPNVVVILSDDQGWGDLSLNGNPNIRTPHVDSLARDGGQFLRFYVCPVCSPTRAEFLTGRYHPRSGVHAVSTGGERMNADEVTIAQTFKAAGYATGLFGKWHNGQQYPYHPNARGFEEFYGFCSGHWGDYFSPPLDHNGETVVGHGYLEDDFTDKAMTFIEQHHDQPFFAYLAFNAPHSPMQVPDRWWDEFKDKELTLRGTNAEREDINHTRAVLAMCEDIDWNVGRVLEKLDELGIAENTIVVYFCDNGPNGNRWNGGLKGIKGTTDEGGVRSPLVIRWPGKIAPGTRVTQIAGAIDLLPTLSALADVPLVGKKPLDGIDLKPLLVSADGDAKGDAIPAEIRDRMIFSHWDGDVSVCTQQYRLDRSGKLYDLTADPGQLKDVSKRYPQIQARLVAAVKKWKKELLTGLTDDKRPFTIGHPDSKNTQLAAADAVPHGGIRRSNRAPNSSFLTNWTSPGDAITWDAEVLASGDYTVEIYYTCSASDVGSTIELIFNGNRVSGLVAEPNDPPLRGADHDRVPRGESYVKDFRPLKLGTIHLEKGCGKLALRAAKIPASQVMDFRLLELTRAARKSPRTTQLPCPAAFGAFIGNVRRAGDDGESGHGEGAVAAGGGAVPGVVFDFFEDQFGDGDGIAAGRAIDARRLASANGVDEVALLFLDRVDGLRIARRADEELIEDVLFPVSAPFGGQLVGSKLAPQHLVARLHNGGFVRGEVDRGAAPRREDRHRAALIEADSRGRDLCDAAARKREPGGGHVFVAAEHRDAEGLHVDDG